MLKMIYDDDSSFLRLSVFAGFLFFNLSSEYFVMLDPDRILVFTSVIFFMVQFILISLSVLRHDYKEMETHREAVRNIIDKPVKTVDQGSIPEPELFFIHIPGSALLILIFLVIGGVSTTPLRIIAGNIVYIYIFRFTGKMDGSSEFYTYGKMIPAAGLYLMLFLVSYFIFFTTGLAISGSDNTIVHIIVILLSSFISALTCAFVNYISVRFSGGDGMLKLIINHAIAISFIIAIPVLKDLLFFEFKLLWILSFIPFLVLCGYIADHIVKSRQEKKSVSE